MTDVICHDCGIEGEVEDSCFWNKVPPECPNCCRGYLEDATTMSKSGLMAGEAN
ncbi:MAG: hypothetical protein MPK62_01315 [Alphaproteobacteria bacterium]|nr:hypothetical protein [Alphaproteobacteria bacterium]MDA8029774.1 hypothetical protein [Alphaproteobacteria bacterium]